MIGRLRGELAAKYTSSVLIDVNGVGYEVDVPLDTLCGLPNTGAAVTLFTHLIVREDAQLLYGFAQQAERDLFLSLIHI